MISTLTNKFLPVIEDDFDLQQGVREKGAEAACRPLSTFLEHDDVAGQKYRENRQKLIGQSTNYSLSVDYSGFTPTIAINRQESGAVGALLAETQAPNHALETFLPSLDKLFSDFGISLIDIHLFITTSGPGSFTGLRCTYAALKALSRVHGQPIKTIACDEVRAMAWLEMTGAASPILIATQMGKTKAVLSTYETGTGITSRKLIETLEGIEGPVLSNEKTLFGQDSDDRRLVYQPSRASDAARYISKGRSTKTAKTASEIALLEPDYYGDRWIVHSHRC